MSPYAHEVKQVVVPIEGKFVNYLAVSLKENSLDVQLDPDSDESCWVRVSFGGMKFEGMVDSSINNVISSHHDVHFALIKDGSVVGVAKSDKSDRSRPGFAYMFAS